MHWFQKLFSVFSPVTTLYGRTLNEFFKKLLFISINLMRIVIRVSLVERTLMIQTITRVICRKEQKDIVSAE